MILTPDLSSATKKIKIELEDENGQKYNLTVQGNLSKEKIINIIEFAQLFERNPMQTCFGRKECDGKLGPKLWNLITENFRHHTFTSTDLLRIYQDLYDGIQLSVISIYLSRFYLKKQLHRSKNGKQWVYSLVKDTVNYEKENYDKSNQARLLSVPTVYDLHL